MNRTRKLITMLITLLPVLVIILIGILHIVNEYRRLVENADRIFEYELSRRFNREVKIGEVTITPLGTAVLRNIRIAAEKKLARGAMLEAKEVRIKYGWRKLLFQRLGAQSIQSVVVIDPRAVLVRRKNGTFNIQDLLKPPPTKPGPPFKGIVRIINGRVLFHDYYVSKHAPPVTTVLRDVQAYVDAARNPVYTFTGSSKGVKQRFTTARFAGRYNTKDKSLQIDINAKDAYAPFIARYTPVPKNVQVLGGNLDIVAGILFEHPRGKARTSVRGTAEVTGGRLVVPKVGEPIEGIKGRVVLLNQRAFLSLRGVVAGSSLDLVGTVSNFQKPRLNVDLRASNVDFGRVVRTIEFLGGLVQLNPRGTGPLRARITGTFQRPIVDLNATIPQLTIQGYTAGNVALSGTYFPGRFNIGRSRFRLFGGEVAASGTINLIGTPTLSITGRATGINVAALPLPRNLQVTGITSGSFNVSGPILNPVLSVSASLPGGSLNNVRFGSASGQFSYRRGQAQISQMVIRQIEGGTIRVAGAVNLNRFDLIVEAQGVQVARFAEILGQPGLRGIAFFQGRIRGTPTAPAVTGDLELFQARVRGVDIAYASMTLTGEGRTVRVSSAVLRILPGEIRFDGTLTFLANGRIAFDGKAEVHRLTVDKLASILGTEGVPAGGIIEGDLQASGVYVPGGKTLAQSLVDTTASGTIRVEDATVFGYPVRTAVAQVSYRDNVLSIDRALVASQDAEMVMQGNVLLATRQVDIKFSLTNFYLSRLRDALGNYADVSGTLEAAGTVTGPLNDIRVAMQASVDNLVVNNQQYGQAQLALAYEKGLLDSLTLTLIDNGQPRLAFAVDDYNPETNCLASARANITDLSIPLLWSIIANSPFLRSEQGEELRSKLQELPSVTGGSLNGTINLVGCLDNLNGSVDLAASNLALDSRKVESVVLNAALANGLVTLNQFRAVSDETVLTAQGTMSLEAGKINLDINAQNFDLTRLKPWLGDNTPSGTLAAEFAVQGDITTPFIKGSVEVVNPAFGGIQFERFRISTIQIQQNQIEISDAILAGNNYQIVGQGTLPWDWSTMSVAVDRPISFSASMKQQDLSMLAGFIPMVDAARTSGPINANLQISGTLANPNLSGGITVTDGTLVVRSFENEFNNINVNLAFTGNRVVFNQFSATSSLGGSISVPPGGVIDLAGPGTGRVDLRVVANGLIIAERNLLGFQEDINTRIDAGLSVTGNLTSPLVADAVIPGAPAGVQLSNAKFAFIVPQGVVRPERPAFGINPQFNISLNVGPNVTISPPNVSLSVVGRQGSLKGTLTDPVLNLTLEIVEGTLRLAGRRLRVEPGGLIYVVYSPTTEPEVRFNFDAVTNVFATSPLGGRERYEITIHVRGTLDNLQVTLDSSPPGLSQEQMLAALGHVEGIFTSGASQLQGELVSVLGALGTQTIFAPIESLFVEKFGFEAFTLEYQPGQPIALYASTNLFGHYYLSVYWRLTSDFTAVDAAEWQFAFSYRFKRLYNFSIGIDDQQTITFTAGYTNSISL